MAREQQDIPRIDPHQGMVPVASGDGIAWVKESIFNRHAGDFTRLSADQVRLREVEQKAAGGGVRPPEPPRPPDGQEPVRKSEVLGRTEGETDNVARTRYKQFIESGEGRRFPDGAGEDSCEERRIEFEKGVEILPQRIEQGYEDPFDVLWNLYLEGRTILRTKGIYTTAMDVIRNEEREVLKTFINKDMASVQDDHEKTAVIAALALEAVFYYLRHPQREQGQLSIHTAITNKTEMLEADGYIGTVPSREAQILHDWLDTLRNLAAVYDLSMKALTDPAMKELEKFQAAADRYMPKERMQQQLLRSKAVTEAAHRAGVERPDYFNFDTRDPKGSLLSIIGQYVNLETLKCVKTVKVTSKYFYPIYAAYQGLQRFFRYMRMYSFADLLIDGNEVGGVTWGTREIETYYRERDALVVPTNPAAQIVVDRIPFDEQRVREEGVYVPVGGVANLSDEQLTERKIYKRKELIQRPLRIQKGRLHFDLAHDLFRWPDERNRDDYYELMKGSFESLKKAVEIADGQSLPGDIFIDEKGTWIGEFNIAWLLSRTGITKQLFNDINPNLDGIDFDNFTENTDGSARRRFLLDFYQAILPENLPDKEKTRREKILKRIIRLNMGRQRTVWLSKEAVSEFDLRDVNQLYVPVLQAGVDLDECWIDNRGHVRRCFDFDLIGKHTEVTTVTQYVRYLLEHEFPMVDKLIGNVDPGAYGDIIKNYEEVDHRGQIKGFVQTPEASDYILVDWTRRIIDRFIGQQAELIRLQGQKLPFMELVWNFKNKLESETNTALHFHDAGLSGTYSKETRAQGGVELREGMLEGVKKERERIFGRKLNYEEERGLESELLSRGLLRRAMNENLHADAWSLYARKKLTACFLEARMTDTEINSILGNAGEEGNLKPLETLLTILGLGADLEHDIKAEDNFLRVSPTEEIQRKDRFLSKYREMNEYERERRLRFISGMMPSVRDGDLLQENPNQLRQKLSVAIEGLKKEILTPSRKEGGYTLTNLLYSMDFLDPIHWCLKEVLIPYTLERDFRWKENRTDEDNYFDAVGRAQKALTERVDRNEWYWKPGWEWYWVDQSGVRSINLHVYRWAVDAMMTGHRVPFGRYQGEYLYDPYYSRQLNHDGTLNPDYNKRLRVVVPGRGEREDYGISRIRSVMMGWGPRKLEADWSEGFPIYLPELQLAHTLGYFAINKQQVLSAVSADETFAQRRGIPIEKVTNKDRKSWEYLEIYTDNLALWTTAALGPDALEGILAPLTQIASKGVDPALEYDPAPYKKMCRLLGVYVVEGRGGDNTREKLTLYRRRLLELGWKNYINPSPVPGGAEAMENAGTAIKTELSQRQALALGSLEMITGKGGADEMGRFLGIDLVREVSRSKFNWQYARKSFLYLPGGAGLAMLASNIIRPLLPLGAGIGVAGPIGFAYYSALIGATVVSYFQTMDIDPNDMVLFSGFSPANRVNPSGIIKFQNNLLRAADIPVVGAMVKNRRYARGEALRGEKAQGEPLRVGPFPSLLSSKFMQGLILLPRQKFLRGGAMKAGR